ncbi:MAG: hypothetical protein HKP27_13810, partial [Myxococcales bacterium]|nr:hypothetical protein [Myxococcales bacterium]
MPTVQITHALPNPDGRPSVAYDGSFKELPPGVTERRTGRSAPVDIELRDGRHLETPLSLTRNGVCLARGFEPAVDLQSEGLDSDAIVERYYPQVAGLVRRALEPAGIERAVVFDHTIRSRARRERGEKESNGENVGGYANGAHNDNSSASARTRVRLLSRPKALGGSVTRPEPLLSREDAERIAAGHFGIFNVWRHFRSDYPVRDYPLAVLDAASASEKDFQIAKYVYPDRVGEVMNALHRPEHRWIYFSEMRHDEALIFKVFDNAAELGLASPTECPP